VTSSSRALFACAATSYPGHTRK